MTKKLVARKSLKKPTSRKLTKSQKRLIIFAVNKATKQYKKTYQKLGSN